MRSMNATPGPIHFIVRYCGPDYPELHDCEFRIVAVRRRLPAPEEPLDIRSNDELLVLGRVTADDRLDVVHIRANGSDGALYRNVPPKHFSAFAFVDTDDMSGSHEGG
jgi:hypothetical protein